MKKYLLSSGKATDKLEYYVMDLVKLYLQIYPGDIPGADGIGFDFTITNTMKSDLAKEVESKVNTLVSRIQGRFKSDNIKLSVGSVEIVDEKKAKIEINLGAEKLGDIEINLFND